MGTHFPAIYEKRYAQYPRRYGVEYHWHPTRTKPDSKGRCATLVSARKHATSAIEIWQCKVVRVFDNKLGEYVFTYKDSPNGIIRRDGYVK